MYMNKVYYVGTTPGECNGTGIGYKIYKQIEIMKKNGFDVTELCLKKNTGKVKNILSKLPFMDFRADYSLMEQIEDHSIIYIRYFLINYQMYSWIKRIKQRKKNVKIIIELPTYPYDFEYRRHHPYILKDRFWRKRLKKYVDRILTFSDDKEIYGIETVNISNGVDINKIKPRTPVKQKDNTINIIAVAKFSFWHGYDRMIQGLADYTKTTTVSEKIKFYIVGYGDEEISEYYSRLIKENNLENTVILTGKMYGAALDELYNKCELAVDSMGRHRSGVGYNSSLKGKEYLAKGLPIISGVKTELDDADVSFYMRVPADDTPIDIKKVIAFYHKVYDAHEPEALISEIRKYCEKNFDIEKCFMPVIELMKGYQRGLDFDKHQ